MDKAENGRMNIILPPPFLRPPPFPTLMQSPLDMENGAHNNLGFEARGEESSGNDVVHTEDSPEDANPEPSDENNDSSMEARPNDNETTSGEAPTVHCSTIAMCRVIAKHPKKSFGILLGFQLSFVLLTIILLVTGYDILPTNFSNVPLQLRHDEQFLRTQAWIHAKYDDTIHSRFLTGSVMKERSVENERIVVIFDSNTNLFTRERLRAMKAVEEDILSVEGFDKFCLSGDSHDCQKPISVLRFFDGSYQMIDPRLHDPEFNNVSGILASAAENPITSPILDFHLGKDYSIDSDGVHSDITRSIFKLGYNNLDTTEFIMGPLKASLLGFSKRRLAGMRFTYLSSTLYTEDLTAQVLLDLALAVGSFCFIFFFMWFQTGSLFVTVFGIVSLMTSFCAANLVYRIAFQYRYFGVFHVLSVFIILGIGADDIFVFCDNWRATANINYASLEERMSACYRRAGMTMLVTSLTTAIAFFASALSPLLAVSSFGLFSGILVSVNYLSVITFFPSVICLYHLRWEALSLVQLACPYKCNLSVSPESDWHGRLGVNKRIVHFFSHHYFNFVMHKVIGGILLVIFWLTIGFFVYSSTRLMPDEKGVRLFRSNTNYGRAKLLQSDAFKPSDQDDVIQVYMVWGLREQDRSSCHYNAFDHCLGRTIWDDSFDLNPAPAQTALRDFCQRLRGLSDEDNTRLKIRSDPITGDLQVRCFIEDMEKYLQAEMNQYNVDFNLPINADKTDLLMSHNQHVYSNMSHGETFYRHFEVALSHWLADGYSGRLTHDYKTYSSMLGEAIDSRDTSPLGSTGYLYGTRLRYAAIAVNTTLPFGDIGYEQGIPIMENWENFFNEELRKMPPSLSGGFQCTPVDPGESTITNNWHWLKVQKTLAHTAVNGVIIGISLALPILILSTQNIVVGFLATLTIASITVVVIGMIPLAGWKLGVLESLNVSLIVGLSVDYVVHMAEAYSVSTFETRRERTRDMLRHAGVSVLSGAISTLGASLFMVFAKILFFMQFGIFMFTTIGFSLLLSLGLFSATVAICGPEGNFGSIQPFIKRVKRIIAGRNAEDVDCQKCSGKGFHKPAD